ncbi:MAG: transposase [Candidatus Aminicenantales bacterium]
MSEEKTRRRYDRAFKEGAVRLVVEEGQTLAGTARDLGITENMLSRWRKEYLADQGHAFPGKGRMKPDEEEIRQLKRRVTDLEQERDILKKALVIFSKHPK